MINDYRSVLDNIAQGPSQKLRRGITTGTCAQAAAKAAALALISADANIKRISITLPKSKKPWSGLSISIPIMSSELYDSHALATVIKDSGDDTDCTNGTEIRALVSWLETTGIVIKGGTGVGKVTRPGLPVAVGESAINPVPRAMIKAELLALLNEHELQNKGLEVVIEIPEGERLAAKTWNPRIGVTGGLSIIGSSGVVEPASSEAFRRSLYHTAIAFRSSGIKKLYISSGYVGERYLHEQNVADSQVLTVGDHVGFALDVAAKLSFNEVVVVMHIGKLVKIAAGLFNTHSKYGDARLETLAALAASIGAPPSLVNRILSLQLAEEAVPLLLDGGYQEVFTLVAARAAERILLRVSQDHKPSRKKISISCIALDLKANSLGQWPKQEAQLVGLDIVGMGPGAHEYITPAAWKKIMEADVLAGDIRHVAEITAQFPHKEQILFGSGVMADFIKAIDSASLTKRVALLVSGDPTLYSLGTKLSKNCNSRKTQITPGISAFQVLCSKAGLECDDAEFFSVHGRPLEKLLSIDGKRTAIIFADDKNCPAKIASFLLPGLGTKQRMLVGEKMGYSDERIEDSTIEQIATMQFSGLCIAIIPNRNFL